MEKDRPVHIEPDDYYTKRHVAELLEVSVRSVERYCRGRAKKLPPPLRIGRRLLWKGAILRRWMDNRSARALEETP